MTKNIIKIVSTKSDYFVKDGVIFAKPANAYPNVGKDNKMYLAYDLGFKLTIPSGVIAMILPPNDASKYSVFQSGNFVLLPGVHESVTIEYKINTDAIPRVFEQQEICAQIVFISTKELEFESIVEETKEDAKEDVSVDSVKYDAEQNLPETSNYEVEVSDQQAA